MTAPAAQPHPDFAPPPPAAPALTLGEAVQVVAHHQRWRRGEVDTQQHSSRLIGRAIDVLLDHARSGDASITAQLSGGGGVPTRPRGPSRV